MLNEQEVFYMDCGGCDEGDSDDTLRKLSALVGKKVVLSIDDVFTLRKDIPNPGLFEIVGCGSYVDPRNGTMPFGTEVALRRIGPPTDGDPALRDLVV
ncbi:MAG: hypothetical protein K8T91_14650 [Planctomycetes bacterium]|nr:hypothetical protein [Planctomycetota bacterium]